MKKILAAGHICLDITPVFPSDRPYAGPAELLIPGTLVHMDKADVHTGGSVANTGLAMKKLGADVELLGKVGDDAFGSIVRQIAMSYGAGGLLVDPESPTSYSVILAIPGLDRIFLHNPGANSTFCSHDIPESAFENAGLIHFGYPPIMKKIYENDGTELADIFCRAKAHGLLTSLDMAAVDPDSEEAKVDWQAFLKNVLPLTDYFLPSFDEISFMLGGEKDLKTIGRTILDFGAGLAVIKCGTDGIFYMSQAECGMQPCIKAPYVASATGAGDAAIAAFLVAVMQGRSIKDSVALAAAEGACAVTAYDALSGLKPLDELEEMIKCS